MSVTKLAKKYVSNSENEAFNIYIGSKNIKVEYENYQFEFKRWHNPEEKIIFYSAFFKGYISFLKGDYRMKEEVDRQRQLIAGLKFISGYFDEYSKMKKAEGWLIVREKNTEDSLDETAMGILDTINFLPSLHNFKDYVKHKFQSSFFIEQTLAGKLPEELNSQFQISYQSIEAINQAMEDFPLCVANTDVKELMRNNASFNYHGSTFTLNREDQNSCFVVKYSNQMNTTYPYPLAKEDFVEILNNVEQMNRIKNTIQPACNFFNSYIHSEIGDFQLEIIQREFENITPCFGDWTNVEKLFKELYDRSISPVDVHEFKHSPSGQYIECKRIEFDHKYIWVVVKEWKNRDLKLFVSLDTNTPNEVNEAIVEFIRKLL